MRSFIPLVAISLAACAAPGDNVQRSEQSQTSFPCVEGFSQELDGSTDHCYMFFSESATWDQARANCEALPGPTHLVSVNSEPEHFLVVSLHMGLSPEAWLGGTDADVEDTWVWAGTSEAVTLDYWLFFEPDGGSEANCMSLQFDRWSDERCGRRYGYICERDADSFGDTDGGVPLPGADGGTRVPIDDPDGDDPGSLYACAVVPGGASPMSPGSVWLLACLGAALAWRRRRGRRGP